MAVCEPRRLNLLLICILLSLATADVILDPSVEAFIPDCARTCFSAFVQDNFNSCGSDPTLDCLCSSDSAGGYTIGEGALQCIISETKVGFCQGIDASDGVISNAYTMCTGQANAISNTHKTLTATLVVQSASPSIVLLAPDATSTSPSASPSASVTGTLTASIDPSAPTTLATSTTAISSSPTSAPVASQTAATNKSTAPSSPGLTSSQKIGVIAGSVGAAVVAVMGILFFCLRKRRQRIRDSDMLPFQADPDASRSYTSVGQTIPPMTSARGGAQQPRVPLRLETSDPYMFSRTSVRPDVIGVAVSPERNGQNYAKRASKLLPDRPTMMSATAAPVELPVSNSQIYLGHAQLSRQSTATDIEDELDETAADESWGRASSDLILEKDEDKDSPEGRSAPNWRSPPTVSISTGEQPVRSEADSYIRPLSLNRGFGSFSRPRPAPQPGRPSQGPKLQLRVPINATRAISQSSSVYSSQPESQRGYSQVPSTRISSTNPFSYQLPPRQPPARHKSYGQHNPNDRFSTGSLTSIESTTPIEEEDRPRRDRNTIMTDLSPVVESPVSALGGRSPVSYPRIPGRLSQHALQYVPPPEQPDFNTVSPESAVRPGEKPWQAAERAAAERRRNDLAAENPYYQRSIPPSQRLSERVAPVKVTPQPTPKLQSPFQPRVVQQSQAQNQSQWQGQGHQRQRSRDNAAPPTISKNNLKPPLPQYPQTPPPRSQTAPPEENCVPSGGSGSSNLLAKRLGAEKAAGLQLGKEGNQSSQKWRVLDEEERERAKDPRWRPQLGRATDDETWRDPLPQTPGWTPKLTPTRRGEDLYLKVA